MINYDKVLEANICYATCCAIWDLGLQKPVKLHSSGASAIQGRFEPDPLRKWHSLYKAPFENSILRTIARRASRHAAYNHWNRYVRHLPGITLLLAPLTKWLSIMVNRKCPLPCV